MKQDCIHYSTCRLPVSCCNSKCKLYNMSCFDCVHNWQNEECELNGHEIYDCSFPCKDFEEAK